MKDNALFISNDCPEGFFIPKGDLLEVNLVNNSLTFKSERYLYKYYFNTTVLCLVNLKTLKKIIVQLNTLSLDDKKDFENLIKEDMRLTDDMELENKTVTDTIIADVEQLEGIGVTAQAL